MWNEKAHEILLELDFVQPNPKVEPCIYSRINCDKIMYIASVNDFLMMI